MPQSYISNRDFLIPQQGGFIEPSMAEQQAAAQQFVPTQPEALPPLPQGLANREGLTSNLFNAYGQLKSYITEMSRQGVDVTRPDYTQEGGGLPYKTYKKIEADILMTANDLKNELNTQNQLIPQLQNDQFRLASDVDPRSQLLSAMDPRQIGYSTELFPEVAEAQKILQSDVYSPADQARYKKQVLDPLVQELYAQKSAATRTADKERIQMNIDALQQQPYKTPYSAFQAGGKSKLGSGGEAEFSLLKELTSTMMGAWPEGSFKIKRGADDQPVAVSDSYKGSKMGTAEYTDKKGTIKQAPIFIDHWEKLPSGEVYVHFKQPEDLPEGNTQFAPVQVDKLSPSSFAAQYLEQNKGQGKGATLRAALEEGGFINQFGVQDNAKVFGKDYGALENQSKTITSQLTEKAKNSATIKVERTKIKKKLDDLGWGSPQKITLPSGSEWTITSNWGRGYTATDENGKEIEFSSKEEISQAIEDSGYYDTFLNASPEVDPDI